jgi:RNase H-fold protein (predicted Holliday junction resolvase)
VGDDHTGVVTPLAVFSYRGTAAAARSVRDAAIRHRVDRIVVGWPTRADGRATPACRRSEALLAELGRLGMEAVRQPEYLSSDEARRRARAARIPSSEPVDHLAAQVLLEEYLASLSGVVR